MPLATFRNVYSGHNKPAPEAVIDALNHVREHHPDVTFVIFLSDTRPDDPLVIRFVKGGCLVVAAWGDEAAYINDAVNLLKA